MKILHSALSTLNLGDKVAAVATPIARALHLPCIDRETGELLPDSHCAKRKAWLNGLAASRQSAAKYPLFRAPAHCLDAHGQPIPGTICEEARDRALKTQGLWAGIQRNAVFTEELSLAPGRQPSNGADGHYEIILRGGLGDCFLQLFNRGAYTLLRDLSPLGVPPSGGSGERATIYAAVHNSHALELFSQHPKIGQISLKYCPVRNLLSDFRRCHAEWGLADQGHDTGNPHLPERERTFDFYPSPSDLTVLSGIQRIAGQSPIIVLQHSAGERNRDIPSDLLARICPILWEKGYFIVTIGRNYARRPLLAEDARHFSSYCAVNQLTVPGTARLLQQSSGLVTCHSSLNILAWYLRKPQLLLYPPHTAAAHFSPKSDPRWSFGRDFPETTHCPFAAFTPDRLDRFIAALRAP